MRFLRIVFVLVLTAGLAACNEAWIESLPDGHDTTRRNGGNGSPDDLPEYRFQNPEVLLHTLTDTLGVQESTFPGSADEPASPNNPKRDPVGFLKARLETLGTPGYDPDPYSANFGGFSSLGMKNWVLATNGACAISMAGPKGDELFPASEPVPYQTIYVELLGRVPTAAEIDELDTLTTQSAFAGDALAQRTAVCTALLGTLDFLSAN